jgi:hypothetical protein
MLLEKHYNTGTDHHDSSITASAADTRPTITTTTTLSLQENVNISVGKPGEKTSPKCSYEDNIKMDLNPYDMRTGTG